jgi:hypothetical protein
LLNFRFASFAFNSGAAAAAASNSANRAAGIVTISVAAAPADILWVLTLSGDSAV